jgi:hypothetical protein
MGSSIQKIWRSEQIECFSKTQRPQKQIVSLATKLSFYSSNKSRVLGRICTPTLFYCENTTRPQWSKQNSEAAVMAAPKASSNAAVRCPLVKDVGYEAWTAYTARLAALGVHASSPSQVKHRLFVLLTGNHESISPATATNLLMVFSARRTSWFCHHFQILYIIHQTLKISQF